MGKIALCYTVGRIASAGSKKERTTQRDTPPPPPRGYGGRSGGGGGGIWYFDVPSPNTTVFSVLYMAT
jgi:hypothetical protein